MGIYKLSFKNLRRRKLRSALTMLGIVIGVVALMVLVGLGSGMQSYMKVQTESMMGDVTITNSSVINEGGVQSMAGLSPDAVSKLKNMTQIYNIKEEIQFSSELNGIPILVLGLSDWSQMKIKEGNTGVVITETLADQLDYTIGSKIKIKDQEMTVTGITEVGGGINPLIVAINFDEALPLNNNRVSTITANTRGDPDVISDEIADQLSGTMVTTKSDMTKQIDDMLQGITLFVGAIASIALLVGVISIINIMLVNVTERTKEIGVLKSIGFTNREVLGSILAEAGLLGFTGALIGVITAAVLLEIAIILFAAQIGMQDINLTYMMPLWLVGGVIGGATFLSVLAGLYPAWKASRLNVVEALRYE